MNILLLAVFAIFSLFGEGFAPETLVLVPGNKHVRIDSLKPGEYVLSQDEQGKTVENRILAVRKQKVNSYEEVKFPKWYFFSSTLKAASDQKFQCPTNHNWQTISENGSDNKSLCCKEKDMAGHYKNDSDFGEPPEVAYCFPTNKLLISNTDPCDIIAISNIDKKRKTILLAPFFMSFKSHES